MCCCCTLPCHKGSGTEVEKIGLASELGPRHRERRGHQPSGYSLPGTSLLLVMTFSLVSPQHLLSFWCTAILNYFNAGTRAQALTSCPAVAAPIKQGLDTRLMRTGLSQLRDLTGLSLGSSSCAERLSCLDSMSPSHSA